MSVIFINPYRFGVAYDTDAQAYITAVETADGQALETAVRDAINAFVVGCKADGIWSAIKASCILAGARTLNGALVPLVGAAPTNVGGLFVAGDYNRKTGLLGNGSTKYLDSNRNNNADPQNSKHLAAYVSDQVGPAASRNDVYIGTNWSVSGAAFLGRSGISARVLTVSLNSAVSGETYIAGSSAPSGFFGVNRSTSSEYLYRYSASTTTRTAASVSPLNENIFVFRNGTGSAYSSNRISFYSIGESLDLALLDSRVTTLINAIAAAIP